MSDLVAAALYSFKSNNCCWLPSATLLQRAKLAFLLSLLLHTKCCAILAHIIIDCGCPSSRQACLVRLPFRKVGHPRIESCAFLSMFLARPPLYSSQICISFDWAAVRSNAWLLKSMRKHVTVWSWFWGTPFDTYLVCAFTKIENTRILANVHLCAGLTVSGMGCIGKNFL